MNRAIRIFVPRLMDAANTNAQNLNARALLSRFESPRARWIATYYDEPEQSVIRTPRVEFKRLWRRRFWHWHMMLSYQEGFDAIFYPGMAWFDERGLALRKLCGRRVPVIGTLEGLAGDESRERQLETLAGHTVHCHRVGREVVERCDRILHSCDHIIAITPMLAEMGRALYGDKVSLLPLGIDTRIFHQTRTAKGDAFRVIGVGNLKENKRPELFLELAQRYPAAKFVWFGQGPLLDKIRARISESSLSNVEFPGTASPSALAEEYNRSDLFLLPSRSEGGPKVLQEAAACGLPRIAFGFYEPMISDGLDGFIVWKDEEIFARIGELMSNRMKVREMGSRAAATAVNRDWNLIAPQWETVILKHVDRLRSR